MAATKETYEYLEHSADIKFKAYGINLEGVFTNCAYALTDIITDHDKVEKITEKKILCLSKTKEALLYDFLEELIVLIDKEHFFISNVILLLIEEKEDGFHLEATIVGDSNSKITETITKQEEDDTDVFNDKINVTKSETITKEKYVTQGDIKAITYHEMELVEDKTGLIYATIVVDV